MAGTDDSTSKHRIFNPFAPKGFTEDLKLALQPFEDTGIPVQTWTTTELNQHFNTPQAYNL